MTKIWKKKIFIKKPKLNKIDLGPIVRAWAASLSLIIILYILTFITLGAFPTTHTPKIWGIIYAILLLAFIIIGIKLLAQNKIAQTFGLFLNLGCLVYFLLFLLFFLPLYLEYGQYLHRLNII